MVDKDEKPKDTDKAEREYIDNLKDALDKEDKK